MPIDYRKEQLRSRVGQQPVRKERSSFASEGYADQIVGFRFETGVVRYPALSPAHFWNSTATDSGAIILLLEAVDEGEVSRLHEEEIETLAPYFSVADNAMERSTC